MIDWHVARLPTQIQRLANGLTVIAHADAKAPVVAVYVGYRAGSRDEPVNRAGLAHVCEHLMFTGTKRAPGSYFAPFEQAGAAWMNALVKEDYSAYFATVPAGSLDFALSMEADRMAGLAEALSEEKVQRQRDVVINELRQREGEPYGCSTRHLAELMHHDGHPYAHPPDGVLEQLDNITLRDAYDWILSRHVPAAAVLVIAGDVPPAAAIEKARHYFEPIQTRPRVSRPPFITRAAPSESRRFIEQAVSSTRIYLAWNGPGLAAIDYPAWLAAGEILAGGGNSRLAIRLIRKEQLASEVAIELNQRELGSLLALSITPRPGTHSEAIEAAVRDDLERLAADGPSPGEFDIARLRLFGTMVRGLEHVGGRRGKAEALGIATLVGGAPDLHERHLSAMAAMQPESVPAAVRDWLSADCRVLEIQPNRSNAVYR